MNSAEQEKLEAEARSATGGYKDANAETKMAFLRAIATELGMGKAVDTSTPLQAALLDEIRATLKDKSLLQKAAFVRGAIDAADLDAVLRVNGPKRKSHFDRIGSEKGVGFELA